MGLDFSKAEPDWDVLLASIRRSEGGDKASTAYGIKSVPTKGEADARQIALNTAKNSYRRWQEAGMPGDFLDHMAARYVPESADPQGNKNWRRNVPAIYTQLAAKKAAPAPVPAPAPAPVPAPIPTTPVQAPSIFSEPLEQISYAGQLPRYIP